MSRKFRELQHEVEKLEKIIEVLEECQYNVDNTITITKHADTQLAKIMGLVDTIREEAGQKEYVVTIRLEGLETVRVLANSPLEAIEKAKELDIYPEDLDFSASYETNED